MRIQLNRCLHGWDYIARGSPSNALWLTREDHPDKGGVETIRLLALTWTLKNGWRARARASDGTMRVGVGETVDYAIEGLNL